MIPAEENNISLSLAVYNDNLDSILNSWWEASLGNVAILHCLESGVDFPVAIYNKGIDKIHAVYDVTLVSEMMANDEIESSNVREHPFLENGSIIVFSAANIKEIDQYVTFEFNPAKGNEPLKVFATLSDGDVFIIEPGNNSLLFKFHQCGITREHTDGSVSSMNDEDLSSYLKLTAEFVGARFLLIHRYIPELESLRHLKLINSQQIH